MEKFRIGCSDYTWQMIGEKWQGSMDNILDVIAEAGYEGVETTSNMVEKYYESPEKFFQALDKRNLRLASLGNADLFGYTDSAHMKEEIRQAEKVLDFAAQFPGCHLILSGGRALNSKNIRQKFQIMCNIYNEIGKKGAKMGMLVECHPPSCPGSLIQSNEEYDQLMKFTDPSLVGFCPDTGHIIRGGANLLAVLEKHISRVRHIHFKDVDSQNKWAMMGQGTCNFPDVLVLLKKNGYKGWIIAEEESNEAGEDPKIAVSKNRQYLCSIVG